MLSVLFRIDPVSNPLLLFTAQIVAIMSVFLLAAGYLKSDPKSASARVFAVIALFVVFYLLNGMSGDSIDLPKRAKPPNPDSFPFDRTTLASV